MTKPKKPKFNVRESYLALIRNSVGSTLFRSLYFDIEGKTIDVLNGGDLSCATYVSSIMHLLRLVEHVHTTVVGTLEDMEASGWKKIKEPRVGAVIVWDFKKLPGGKRGGHRHLGFYLGDEQAVSNSSKKRRITQHHMTFGYDGAGDAKRDIQGYYWHPWLN